MQRSSMILTPMLLLLAVFGVGCTEARYRSCIERVLIEDSDTTLDSSDATPGDYYNTVVHNMDAISLKGCPDDFCDAYEDHIEAWSAARKFVVRADNRDTSAFARAFREGVEQRSFLRGLAALFDDGAAAREEADRLSEGISETFRKVLRVARRHGVDTSEFD